MELPMELLGAIELVGAMEFAGAMVLPLVMPVSGFFMLSEGLVVFGDMLPLGALILLAMLLWAKAAGPRSVRAQAAAVRRRDMGLYSGCWGRSPWRGYGPCPARPANAVWA